MNKGLELRLDANLTVLAMSEPPGHSSAVTLRPREVKTLFVRICDSLRFAILRLCDFGRSIESRRIALQESGYDRAFHMASALSSRFGRRHRKSVLDRRALMSCIRCRVRRSNPEQPRSTARRRFDAAGGLRFFVCFVYFVVEDCDSLSPKQALNIQIRLPQRKR